MDGGGRLKLKEKLVVANTGEDTLTFIDRSNMRIDEVFYLSEIANKNVKSISSSPSIGPWDMIYDGCKFLYCTNAYDNSVFKINLDKGKIVDKLYVGSFPTSIKSIENYIFIANTDSNSISVISEKEFYLIENIPVGGKPIDIEVDKIKKKIYIANSDGYSINIIDLKGVKNEIIRVKNNPIKMIIEGDFMYILYSVNNNILSNSNISIMNLKDYREEEIIQLKGIFTNMLKLNNREIAFVTNIDKGYIYRVDIEKRNLLSKTKLVGMPNRIEWDGDNTVFITDISEDIIYLFDIEKNIIIDGIRVGKEPGGILII